MKYTVAGTGAFPIDMLRYDAAYPARPEDALSIARTYQEQGREIQVTLCSRRAPTVARWESFGWHLVEVDERGLSRHQRAMLAFKRGY